MPGRSISLRLIVGASLWIVLALVISGVVLTGMFRVHVERVFDSSLHDHLEELLALSEVDKDGRVALLRQPAASHFNRPFSGWYWEMAFEDGRDDRSRSLWDQKIILPQTLSSNRETAFTAQGPRGQPLRGVARTFTLPESETPFSILVAGPAEEIETAVSGFANTTALALAVLGLGLIGAVTLQVRFGLSPLKRMRKVLAEIRSGRASRMEGNFAAEIEPLADELNALLDHNTEIIERARTQAGNLAHALKTPLAVLTNEANRLDGKTAKVVQHQTALMNDHISRHLSRARVAATRGVLGSHSKVHEVADRLHRTLRRIYEHRGIGISLEGTEPLAFQGEQQDLEEMLGNLMDNACKWARRRVVVRAQLAGENGDLIIDVIDDGPGIPEESLAEVLDRGSRLDESTPGSGLGLSIVRDIAGMYNGSLELRPSSLGGLNARLKLPGPA